MLEEEWFQRRESQQQPPYKLDPNNYLFDIQSCVTPLCSVP